MNHEVKVDCSPETLWQIVTDVSSWHRISRYHGPARWFHGKPWVKGSRFRIEVLHPLRDSVECTVHSATAPLSMAWIAEGLGVKVERQVQIIGTASGCTIHTQARVLSGRADWSIEPAMELFSTEWLQAIKEFVENPPLALVSNQ